MNPQPPPHPADHYYELRIDGHLGEHWSTWFDGLSLTHTDDGATILSGPVTDQAQLHGLITKIRNVGATLLSVNVMDADSRHVPDSPHSTSPDDARTPRTEPSSGLVPHEQHRRWITRQTPSA